MYYKKCEKKLLLIFALRLELAHQGLREKESLKITYYYLQNVTNTLIKSIFSRNLYSHNNLCTFYMSFISTIISFLQ